MSNALGATQSPIIDAVTPTVGMAAGSILTSNGSVVTTLGISLSQIEGGAYFGRVGLTENQWSLSQHGVTWTARDSSRDWQGIALSSDGRIQTAVHYGGNIYISDDYGDTWTAKDSARNWYSVAMSSDGKYQLAGTDTSDQLYISDDYGETWTAKESNRNWRGVAVSSDGKIQTALSNSGNIYVSVDYGDTWTAKDSSRDWRSVAMSSDGKIQTAVVYSGQIYVSSDYGDTWTAKDSSRFWASVAMSSDGKIQTAVVTGGNLYISDDYGETWATDDSVRDWRAVAMSSDGLTQIAVVGTGKIYVKSVQYYAGSGWVNRASILDWRCVAMSSDGKVATAGAYSDQLYVSYADSSITGDVDVDGSINNVTITAPATNATLTIADGKTLTVSNTITLEATDGSTLDIGTGGTLGTLAYQDGTFSGTSSGTNTGDQTSVTGNAGTVTTNANLTGHVTSVGNATVLGSFTKAQLSAAVNDGTPLYSGDSLPAADLTGNIAVASIATALTTPGAIGGTTPSTMAATSLSCPTFTSAAAIGITPTAGSNLNITTSGAGDVVVNTSQFVVDSSTGDIGLGTASPTYRLDIVDDTSSVGGFRVTNNTAGSAAQIQNVLKNDNGRLAYSGLTSSTFSTYSILNSGRAFFGGYLCDVVLFTQTAKSLIFGTSGTQRAVMLPSGYMGVNVATPTALMHLGASTTARASLCVPSGTAPTSPVNGDIWSDGSDLLMRLGGTTYTFTKT